MKPRFASTIRLPERQPEGTRTVFDYFLRRFPRIAPEVWLDRFRAGKIATDAGPLTLDAPFEPLVEVYYQREVEREWPARTDYRVVHEDARLLVVDKPPFLPVIPGGHYVRHCLLNLLIESTGNDAIAPLHRLDKDTSGITLFSKCSESRSHFARMFLESGSQLTKEYLAVCDVTATARPLPARFEDHIARDAHDYHLQAIHDDRPPNSVCDVELVETKGARALLRVHPVTGRKHQIRVQLSHAGYPIVNDRLYGLRPRFDPEDLSEPLQLNCHRIAVAGYPGYEGEGTLDCKWVSEQALEW
jgi:tRNA pseudouridine32 synthase / 23S rRNA pseudouridine746 synthase